MCRVCGDTALLFFKNERTFYKCPQCWLIFTNEISTSSEQETHYKKQWRDEDKSFWKGQVDVLEKIIGKHVKPRRILDFGSGSGALTQEFQSRNYDVTPVEPMVTGYLKDQNFTGKFNVVLAVEVFEHLLNLWDEIEEIEKILEPGGIILAATALTNPFIQRDQAQEEFKEWWYKDDPTHVNFFCNKTLEVMGAVKGWIVTTYANNMFVAQVGL